MYHKKSTVNNFIFVLLSDANRTTYITCVDKPPHIVSLFFCAFLMFNAEKCSMLFESKKAEHFGYSKMKHLKFWGGLPSLNLYMIPPGVNSRL